MLSGRVRPMLPRLMNGPHCPISRLFSRLDKCTDWHALLLELSRRRIIYVSCTSVQMLAFENRTETVCRARVYFVAIVYTVGGDICLWNVRKLQTYWPAICVLADRFTKTAVLKCISRCVDKVKRVLCSVATRELDKRVKGPQYKYIESLIYSEVKIPRDSIDHSGRFLNYYY